MDKITPETALSILVDASSGSEGLKTFAAIALQAMDSEVDTIAGAYKASDERDAWRGLFKELL